MQNKPHMVKNNLILEIVTVKYSKESCWEKIADPAYIAAVFLHGLNPTHRIGIQGSNF
jgi:hypothetical protein